MHDHEQDVKRRTCIVFPNRLIESKNVMAQGALAQHQHLPHPHDKYVVLPVYKAHNNIVFVCKSHRLLNKGIRYCQFTWPPYIYLDDTYERGNLGQS